MHFQVLSAVRRQYWPIGLSAVSAVLVILSNWSGVGWSWDSSDYVATGINISNGRGALDVTGVPMTVRPPGFPALIAIGDWIGFGSNLTLVGINVASAITVVLCTYLILNSVSSRRTVVILGTAFVVVSPALLWQYSMAWSEPSFVAVEALAILVALSVKNVWKYPILVALFTALFFIRFVGPVFSVAIIFVSIIADLRRRNVIRAIVFNVLALVASLIPAWWWLLRNRRIDGTFTGIRQAGGGTLLDSAKTLPGTMGTWLTGNPFDSVVYPNWSSYPQLAKLSAILCLGVFALLCGAIAVRAVQRRQLPDRTFVLCAVMMISITVGYSVFSVYRYVHWELGRFDNRMMIPIYMPLVVLFAILIDLGLSQQRRFRRAAAGAFLALLGVHAIASGTDAWTFGREGRHMAAHWFHDLSIHKFVRSLPSDSGLFSNAPQQLYATVQVWPVFSPWQAEFARPVPCKHRYAVWYKSFVVQDNKPELTQVLFDDDWGTVYDLGACDIDINLIWD